MSALRERPTVRVLLLDPDNRVLLMKGRWPSMPAGGWFAVGGGVEPGETLLEAAAREVREETGFSDVTFGPLIWRRGGPLTLATGERVMMAEQYIVARCAGGEPSRAGWDETERQLVMDLRWWSADDLAACSDVVYPAGLAALLPDVVTGRHPSEPLLLPWA